MCGAGSQLPMSAAAPHHTKPRSGFGAAPVDGVRSVSSRPRPRWQIIYFCTLMKYIFSSVDSLVLRGGSGGIFGEIFGLQGINSNIWLSCYK